MDPHTPHMCVSDTRRPPRLDAMLDEGELASALPLDVHGSDLMAVAGEILDDQDLLNSLSKQLTGCKESEGDLAETCWGSQAMGSAEKCTPGFVSHKHHFQHKFCSACRSKGIHVPADSLRVMKNEVGGFENSRRAGFWNQTSPFSALSFRRINQASGCKGNPLLITNVPFAPTANLEPVPDTMIDRTTGTVHLVVSLGTLVPKAPAAIRGPSRALHRKRPVPNEPREEAGGQTRQTGRPSASSNKEQASPATLASSVEFTQSSSGDSRETLSRRESPAIATAASDGSGDDSSDDAGVLGYLHHLNSAAQRARANPDLTAERECLQPHLASRALCTLFCSQLCPWSSREVLLRVHDNLHASVLPLSHLHSCVCRVWGA